MKKTMKMMIGLAAMLCAASVMAANWDDYTYHVVYDDNGGSGGSGWSGWTSLDMPLPSQVSCPTRTGYTFTGYKVDGATVYDSNGKLNPAYTSVRGLCAYYNPCYLKAIWQANTYTVTLDKQGGTSGSASVTATYGAAMPTATMPTRTGYIFLGYFDATEGGKQYYDADGKSVASWDKAEATTLAARWVERTAGGIAVALGSATESSGEFHLPGAVISGKASLMTVSVNGSTITSGADGATAVSLDGASATFLVDGAEDAQSILRGIGFAKTTEQIKITVTVDGNETVLPEGDFSLSYHWATGHYYAFVPRQLAWTAAYNEAKSFKLAGQRGYLVTLANADEYDVLHKISTAGAWTGGTALLYADDTKIDDPVSITRSAGILKLPSGRGGTYNIFWDGDAAYSESDQNRGKYFYWTCGPECGHALDEYTLYYRDKNEPNGYYWHQKASNAASYEAGKIDDTMEVSTDKFESCIIANNNGDGGMNDIFECGMKAKLGGYFVEFGGYPEGQDPGHPDAGLTAQDTLFVNTPTYTVTLSAKVDHMTYSFKVGNEIMAGTIVGDKCVFTVEEGSTAVIVCKALDGFEFVEGVVNPIVLSNIKENTVVSAFPEARAYVVVTLDPNGGEGGTASVHATPGAALPAITVPTKANADFLGYFDASGKQYYNADGTSAANWDKTEAAILYAQWQLPSEFALVSAKQRWPWNGKVDLVYTAKGLLSEASYWLVIAVKASGKEASVRVEIPSENGTKSLVVDLDAMLPAETQDVAAQLNVKLMSVE